MQLLLLSPDEFNLRIAKVREAMTAAGIEAAVVQTNANLYYLTGRVFCGYIYISADTAVDPVFFVKRPVVLHGDNVVRIHKPENIASELARAGIHIPGAIGLELSLVPYSMALRMQAALGASSITDVSGALMAARAVKTPHELSLLRVSGAKHDAVYRKIPRLFRPGMSDIELQVEIERVARLEGCLGQFRVNGQDMEIFMGNVLAGENADAPSPYDFAMGGAGLDPSLPVGADGTIVRPGMSVMIDMNGNFTGYMTDMTRTFAPAPLEGRALDAHKLSVDICRELARMGRPGIAAADLYNRAVAMAEEAGLAEFFMGHRQHAGFVGHGVGIEINELPVIAPRSKAILEAGNVIALEPKFVIPGIGAVGVENTYVVNTSGDMEAITRSPQEIIIFEE